MLALQQGHLQLAKSLVGLLLVLLWHDQVFDPHQWELVVQNGVGDVVKELLIPYWEGRNCCLLMDGKIYCVKSDGVAAAAAVADEERGSYDLMNS